MIEIGPTAGRDRAGGPGVLGVTPNRRGRRRRGRPVVRAARDGPRRGHRDRARRRRADGHRVGAGRHRRGRGARTTARRSMRPTRSRAGAGLCDPAAVAVLVHEAPEAVGELRGDGHAFRRGRRLRARGRAHGAPGAPRGRRPLGQGAAPVPARRRSSVTPGSCASTAAPWRSTCATASPAACGSRAGRSSPPTGSCSPPAAPAGSSAGAPARTRRSGRGSRSRGTPAPRSPTSSSCSSIPTALDVPGHPARLLTEALRGEGAVLRDAAGDRFMDRFHPLGDLAPRDVVARAVLQVREETGAPVVLDATAVPDVAAPVPDRGRAVPRGRARHRDRTACRWRRPRTTAWAVC